jgi:tripartite-type tricarboxylate transporter receptor subunit TctC
MTHTRRRVAAKLAALAIVGTLAPFAAYAQVQDWPTKPVRLVVPLTPGSGADIVARVLGRKLSDMWGQPVIIDNKPGAGGQIGTGEVVRSIADGHTLLVQSASHAANPAIYKSLPYDPLRDLVDVSLLATTPYVMVAQLNGPFKDVKSVVDTARAKPDSIFFASAGVGTSTHLTAERFTDGAGVKLTHLPFKGSPDAIVSVSSGDSAFYMAPLPTVSGMLKGGRVAPIAVTSKQRIGSLPNVPTVAESGIPNFEAELWVGLWAPSATPATTIAKISADFTKALQSPDVQEQYAKVGNQVRIITPAEFAKFVREEIEINKELVRKANIQQQ